MLPMRTTLLIPLLLTATQTMAQEKPPARQPDRTPEETGKVVKSLEAKFKEILKKRKVPGVAIVVVKDDKIVYLNGLGLRDVKKKLPFTPDSIVHIASTSKAFCGITMAMAVQDGLLKLDESPKRLLPYFKMVDPEADAKFTLADLLCHSSGLPRTDSGWWTDGISSEEASRLLGQGEPTYPFRYVGQYSNMMVETGGLAVAAAYGKPWLQVLEEKITKPLGMTSTRKFSMPSDTPDRAATGYFTNLETGQIEVEPDKNMTGIAAAGGLQSTARDMAQWIRFHLNGGSVDGKQLLSPALVEEAHRGRFAYDGGLNYGFGWFSRDTAYADPVVYHGGDLPGFQSNVFLVPGRHLGFGVFCYNDSARSREDFQRVIMEALVSKRDTREDRRLDKATNVYFSADGAHTVRLLPIAPQMWVSIDEGRDIRLNPIDKNRWKSFDPHDAPVELIVKGDFKRPVTDVEVVSAGATTAYSTKPTTYKADITPKALYKKIAEATGIEAARAGKTLECKINVHYASEALDSEVYLYREATGRSGQFELLKIGSRSAYYAHTGVQPERIAFADSTYRSDVTPGDGGSRPWRFAGYCNESAGVPSDAKVEIIGETEFNGEKCYSVRTTFQDKSIRLDFISKSSYLPLRREIPGANYETYYDYRKVDGIAVPFKILQQDYAKAKVWITVTSAKAIAREVGWAYNPSTWPSKNSEKPKG